MYIVPRPSLDDVIVNTIHDARQSVCISVMDFDTVSWYSAGPTRKPQRVMVAGVGRML